MKREKTKVKGLRVPTRSGNMKKKKTKVSQRKDESIQNIVDSKKKRNIEL